MTFFSKSFLPYPNMERQDLTQGQLGSFKFTPVDAVQRDYNKDFLTEMAHREMLTQLQNAAQQAVAMAPDVYPHAQSNSAGCFSNTWSSHGNQQSPVQDTAFFDKHSKPDLADSRLKYGPAALRSAVQSHSPQKTKTPPVIPHHPASNADMNPVASTFVPSGLPTRHDPDEATTTLHTLARSLASEQNAHHATQMALEEALNMVSELENSMKTIEKQNKSLVSAVNMLGGIIKHNQHKLRKRDQTPTKPDVSREGVSAELDEPVEQVSPIVYDVLAKQLAQKEGRSSMETEATSVADSVQVHPIVPADDTDLFNLELLKRPVHEDGAGSALRRTLRRHFIESSDEDNTARLSRVVSPVQSANQLISVSPHDHHSDTQYSSLLAVSQSFPTVNMSATPTKSKVTELANKPVLQLPQSFLAKYKTPAKDRKLPGIPIEDETPKSTTKITTIPSAPAPAPDSSQSPLTSPSRPRIAKLPHTFDLTIRWNVNRENPIWDDDYEKMLALGRESLPLNLQNSFWKHPVRYVEYADKNLFRTVMIDYIPVGTTYKDVLNEISGGSLEQIELFDPIGSVTNYMTARIVFNYELSASTTANQARDHGMKIRGQPVRVWQVLTQTWPKNKQLDEDVFVNCYTRILLITQVDPEQLATIPERLGFLRSSIVEFGLSYDGMPLVEFTSVAAAVKALNVLVNDHELGSAEFDFEEDTCAEPYPAIA